MTIKIISYQENALGKELRRIREEKNMTLEQASNKIGISRQYLSMLERQLRKTPSFDIMYRISVAYEYPLDYFAKFLDDWIDKGE